MIKLRFVVLALAGFVGLVFAGYGLARYADTGSHAEHAAAQLLQAGTDRSQVWTCPMHPQIREHHAGDCPICGMHLVPATDAGAGADDQSRTGDVAAPAAVAHAHSLASSPPATTAWVCPMHSQIHQDHPGKCPICGMDLVRGAAGAEHADHAEGAVIGDALRQTLGVRLATVEQHDMSRDIRTWGIVTIDESSRREVSPKVDGWVRQLHVAAIGESVRAGQALYDLYSPELVQRQREYVDLLQRRELLLNSMNPIAGQNAQVLASLARERMRVRQQFANADVGTVFIDELEKTRRPADVVTVHAQRAGVIVGIGARSGSYVTPQTNLLSIADVSRVWVDIPLHADQWAWVSAGDKVTARRQNGERGEIHGVLQLPNSLLDRDSRTLRARLVVRHSVQSLRPGEYLDVHITTAPHRALVVPRSALIRTGTGDRVMLARDDGSFLAMPVQAGIENDAFVEIVSGLEPADQVAVKGQFLLDAAVAMTQRMSAGS